MVENESWSILKETPYWIAVYKPAGMIVERNPYESPTLEEVVQKYFQTKKRPPFLGVVHRLDKVTSGVVLLAKKKSALKNLNRQFEERKVTKFYWALIKGQLPSAEGKLSHWLKKDQKQKKAIVADTEIPDAKRAKLRYQTLATQNGVTLLEIELLTGRYHQIRAQFAAIGFPLIGDHKYNEDQGDYSKRIALHARKLIFEDPQRGKRTIIEAALPQASWWADFHDIIK